MSNCGCSPQGMSPPNTFAGTVSLPSGGSPFGGMTHVARGPCRPFCPSPPVSSAQVRAPYVPPWLATLTSNPFGRMLVSYGGALYGFQSKCTGPVFYDASTGSVSVQNPPYACAVPKETDYGYLALVVPSSETICRDGQTDCEQEIRQQFASQRIQETDCGDILLWNAPACGQVPPLQASDAANQGRFDRATLDLLDDIDGTCQATGDVTLMAFYPKVVNLPGGGTTTCRQPVRMKRLRFKKSQWGELPQDDAGAANALLMVAKKVGGTDDDPCLELETTDFTLADLHTLATTGMRFYPQAGNGSILINDQTFTGGTVFSVTLPNFPASPPGRVFAEYQIQLTQVTGGGDTQHGQSSVFANGEAIATIGGIGGSNFCYPKMPVATSGLGIQIGMSPSVVSFVVRMILIGYYY